MPIPDPFPQTHRTWMDQRLAAGDPEHAEVLRHVMAVYAGPLQTYLAHTRFRSVAEPMDLVHGFFADRLSRKDYLSTWQSSGKPLRRWLSNGLLFYVREFLRRKKQDSRASTLPPDLLVDDDLDQALDRSFARSVVRLAMEQASNVCAQAGLSQHWHMFIGHNYEGLSHRQLADSFAVTPERVAVMARTASHRFRAAVGEILVRDGVPAERLQATIADLVDGAQ